MFEILPNPSLETVLIAGRAVLLVAAFWVFALAFSRWRRCDERNHAGLQAQLERTFAEVRSLHETVSVLGARLEAMSERELEMRPAPAVAVGAQRGYDMATRLARGGSSVDELVRNCGVTRHEAALMVRLHGVKTRTSATAEHENNQPENQPGHQSGHRPGYQPAVHSGDAARATQMRPAVRESQAAVPPQPPAGAGRKRGSLLSVVG